MFDIMEAHVVCGWDVDMCSGVAGHGPCHGIDLCSFGGSPTTTMGRGGRSWRGRVPTRYSAM